MLQERDDALVVQIAVTEVIADLDADMTGGQAAVEFGASRVGVLQRDLTERQQPVGCAVGLFIRVSVGESPSFAAVKRSNVLEKLPVVAALKGYWRPILLAIFTRQRAGPVPVGAGHGSGAQGHPDARGLT